MELVLRQGLAMGEELELGHDFSMSQQRLAKEGILGRDRVFCVTTEETAGQGEAMSRQRIEAAEDRGS